MRDGTENDVVVDFLKSVYNWLGKKGWSETVAVFGGEVSVLDEGTQGCCLTVHPETHRDTNSVRDMRTVTHRVLFLVFVQLFSTRYTALRMALIPRCVTDQREEWATEVLPF